MGSPLRKPIASPEILKNTPGGRTTWKDGVPQSGWFRFPDAWWDHLKRLQRGLYQRMLIEYVWGRTLPRDTGAVMPEWSESFSYSELAERCGCTAEQVRDDARDAKMRGLLATKESRGCVQFRILWERWPNLNDYTAPRPQLVEKKPQPKIRAHWFTRRVTVPPGESYDFTVPPLPDNFQLQKISFRNTGQSESVTIAGGGPAEGGLIVLETEVENGKRGNVTNKEDIEKTREWNTQPSAGRGTVSTRSSGTRPSEDSGGTREEIGGSSAKSGRSSAGTGGTSGDLSRDRNRRSRGDNARISAELSSVDLTGIDIPRIVEAISVYGFVPVDAVETMIRNCRRPAPDCTTEQILAGVSEVKITKTSENPIGIVLSQVPKRFASGKFQPNQKPAKPQQKTSVRTAEEYEQQLREYNQREKEQQKKRRSGE